MQIKAVGDNSDRTAFLDVAREIYKDDPVWVCPLDDDIESVFDPASNSYFRHGEACRWILRDDQGKLIGRVAAFINKNKAYHYSQPTGGMGFFECIDDQQAAFALFDTCKAWLEERGMEAMDGPINFGENMQFWGLLTEGFTHPAYGMNYNPPYYRQLFEAYGFQVYFEQVSRHLDIVKPLPERYMKIAEWVMKKPDFNFRYLKKNELHKFADDFVTIYNEAWQVHENFVPMTSADILKTFNKMKPIIEEKFIWFAYHREEPIGFFVMIPDINQILKHFKGKMNWWNMLRFAWYKWRKTIDRARLLIIGVVPKYQKSGIESALIMCAAKVTYPMKQYKELDISWVGDFNPLSRALQDSSGAAPGKTHITFRKLFKEDREYQRSEVIAGGQQKSA